MEDIILEEGMQDLGHVGKEKMLSDWILVQRAILAAESGESSILFVPRQDKKNVTLGVSLQISLKFGKAGLSHKELTPADVPRAEHKDRVMADWQVGYNSILAAEVGEFKITHDKLDDEEEAIVGMTAELEIKFHDKGINIGALVEDDAEIALKIAKTLYEKYDIS